MEEKKNNGLVWVLIVIIIILLGIIVYLCKDKFIDSKKETTENTTTTTTTTTTTVTTTTVTAPVGDGTLPAELNNDKTHIETFYDIETNEVYYFVGIDSDAGDVAWVQTDHYIYDKNYTKIFDIPEATNAHYWYANGESILSKKDISIELKDNKIYSLDNDNGHSCDVKLYEIYVKGGKVQSNVTKTISDSELSATGMHC